MNLVCTRDKVPKKDKSLNAKNSSMVTLALQSSFQPLLAGTVITQILLISFLVCSDNIITKLILLEWESPFNLVHQKLILHIFLDFSAIGWAMSIITVAKYYSHALLPVGRCCCVTTDTRFKTPIYSELQSYLCRVYFGTSGVNSQYLRQDSSDHYALCTQRRIQTSREFLHTKHKQQFVLEGVLVQTSFWLIFINSHLHTNEN